MHWFAAAVLLGLAGCASTPVVPTLSPARTMDHTLADIAYDYVI